ncbi:MAG: ferrous iron transport protein B, partial [Candidatus Omnitrophica bacterium]|nr:ferrous iron transport protein B [Candidatus Omnitrophota bacterium]
YSLTAHSLDEVVARNFIIEEKPNVVISVIDSSNVERNLYLTIQLMELEIPLVLAFNMYDLAEKEGLTFDREILSRLLGCPVVFTTATKKRGMNDLLEAVIERATITQEKRDPHITYGFEIDEHVADLTKLLETDKERLQKYPAKWLAVKLLEWDNEVLKVVGTSEAGKTIIEHAEKARHTIHGLFDDDAVSMIADHRYGFISGACSEAVRRTFERRHNISDKIDMVLINRVVGLPIFFALLWGVFKFTFVASEPFIRIIEKAQEFIGQIAGSMLPEGGAVQSLVVDGIIGGVGSVLVFVPIIFLMFMALALLEDSGYMARAAFIMDKLMHKIGLHGRSFIPLLLGCGCTVPAIMATRTIDDDRDRLTTLLISPFISCGARLPVYVVLIGAFFPQEQAGNVLFSVYLIGVLVAVLMAKVLRKYAFKGEAAPFVMELPPYRIPTLKAILLHTWARVGHYLRKASTVIFAGCILVWFFGNFPTETSYSKDYDTLIAHAQDNEVVIEQLENERSSEKMEHSYAGTIGKAVLPVFKPLGFNDWRMPVALMGGFVAKEIVVGTMGTLYAASDSIEEPSSLRQALQEAKKADGTPMYTPIVAYAFMLFVLLYIPCVAVIAVVRKETNSWKWAAFIAVYTTTVAWIVTFIFFQGARLLGFV